MHGHDGGNDGHGGGNDGHGGGNDGGSDGDNTRPIVLTIRVLYSNTTVTITFYHP
jgi:hypothetical protein